MVCIWVFILPIKSQMVYLEVGLVALVLVLVRRNDLGPGPTKTGHMIWSRDLPFQLQHPTNLLLYLSVLFYFTCSTVNTLASSSSFLFLFFGILFYLYTPLTTRAFYGKLNIATNGNFFSK